ncbi:hypothetical protein EZV62_012327 [Acer yangbiense]|uniref:Replication protein A C-terminal domain-containing protein n=1 Tax=Acer yangbiense TaxID=1000413 RepID=A0A5C7HVY8_9ROSI|nr:hypothetical protein EZV62_012327 [Acer yangbiense]
MRLDPFQVPGKSSPLCYVCFVFSEVFPPELYRLTLLGSGLYLRLGVETVVSAAGHTSPAGSALAGVLRHNTAKAVSGDSTMEILDIWGDTLEDWVDSVGLLPLQDPIGLATAAVHSRSRHSWVARVRGEFDGASLFAGGGFMPSQATSAPSSSFSISKGFVVCFINEFILQDRNARTLLPMTVKQINDISSNDESGAYGDGVDSNTVTIVGLVCDIQDKEPQFVFLVDDGTGQVECTRWAHERLEFNEVNQIVRGMYVRVYGHLKSLQDKRSLNAYSMRPVTDFNEITSHFIECIYVHMYNTKLQNSIDGRMSIDQIVLNFLRRPECLAINNGVHCNDIARQLNLPKDKLMEVLESLNENSLVYTVDEVHYKSAVNA